MRYHYRRAVWVELKRLGHDLVPNYTIDGTGINCFVWLPRVKLALFDKRLSRSKISDLYDANVNFRVRPAVSSLKYTLVCCCKC